MKCPECAGQGVKSKVYPGMSTVTAMYYPPFYDEDGVYHHHDSNRTTTRYSCSEGHEWRKISDTPRCPGCGDDWRKKEVG